MYPHVHILCAQDVSKQLEGLAKHLRASGKKPDSPHTQLALIGSSQAVLLVRKPVFVEYTFAVGHYLLTKHQSLQWKVATVGSSSTCKGNLHSYTVFVFTANELSVTLYTYFCQYNMHYLCIRIDVC